jgi:peptidoglycan/LPS O-acetylase OafA/YrhL
MRSQRHIRELDGVRALAILMVLFAHLFFGEAAHGTIARVLPKSLNLIGEHLGRGVDLFFVLSGFLITRILLDSKNKTGYFGTFYFRRALRILPLYLLVIIVSALVYGPSFWGYYWLALFFSANFAPALHVSGPSGMGPMWSLAVEEQFYLFWPLIVYCTSRRRLAMITIALILFEPALRFLSIAHARSPELPVTTWCRSDGLALGSLLALWVTSARSNPRTSTRLALALVLSCAAILVLGIPFGIVKSNEAASIALRVTQFNLLFGALVLIAVAYTGNRWLSPLRSRIARACADYSFCLYLIHVALIDAFDFAALKVAPATAATDSPAMAVLRAALVLPVAFAIAALSRNYLELPFLRMKRLLVPPRAVVAPASATE